MTRDRDALLAAILADPDDDAPRLVFADWLDERGDLWSSARAELIRVGMQLAEYPAVYDPDDKETNWRAREKLRDRQHWLAASFDGIGLIHDELRVTVGQGPHLNYLNYGTGGIVYDVSRGFVSEIRLPTAAFLAHAAELFRWHPVVTVRLTDAVRPVYGDGDHWGVSRSDIGGLWSFLRPRTPRSTLIEGHDPAELERLVSEACVAHGRRLAGLPPLGRPAAVGVA